MTFDIFFSICQTEVDGFLPDEKFMWRNFFDQVRLADELRFGTAWVAETHLSCQVQKRNPGAVIPEFKGEIGLNTDILQLAHKVLAQTKSIRVGSAIRNILCNGGPIAHAEAVRTFLSLHGLQDGEARKLELGFASGRFPFSNVPYGIRPRNAVEAAAWPALRGLIFMEATEIFLRFLRGDIFASNEVRPKRLSAKSFRTEREWLAVVEAWRRENAATPAPESIEIAPFWVFDQVGVIPYEAPMELLNLTIGAHDAPTQDFANTILPVGVFNLSITPQAVIEESHLRMQKTYHPSGGPWRREYMPRTVMMFIDENRAQAYERSQRALEIYWKAMEGTVDPAKVAQATENALVGSPDEVREQMKARFHPDDRLMLWFDLSQHDNQIVKNSMRLFMEKVAARL